MIETLAELMQWVREEFPDAIVDMNIDGEIVIYTGVKVNANDVLEGMPE